MDNPKFAISMVDEKDKRATFNLNLASGLPFGYHHVEVSLLNRQGMTYRHSFVFCGTGCDLMYTGDVSTHLQVKVDGVQMPTAIIETMFHHNLINFLRKLLDTDSTTTHYIMDV